MREVRVEVSYHKNQREIFFDEARFKVIAKGRRFGLTRGFANYVIERMVAGDSPVLWVDTVYGNIERYVERYFKPVLNGLPKELWMFRGNRNDLRILNAVCDFRSADRPENIEGFGYKLVILNEAGIILKNRSLWNESIRPMILDYKADVLIGGTPKGKFLKKSKELHLFYELYERGKTNGELRVDNGELKTGVQWKSYNFSTYDNPLLDKGEIDEMVTEISPGLREQEVYGRFVDAEQEGIIKREWWRRYDLLFLNSYNNTGEGLRIQSWDTAFKKNAENDFSVCTTWEMREDGYYLLDVWRGRVEFPELKKKVDELYHLHTPAFVLIEDKGSGQSLIQELERGTRIPIRGIKVEQDKIARVHHITPLIESGRVYVPHEAHWVKDFLDECDDFPSGQFDDAVDSMSQALSFYKEREGIRRMEVFSMKSDFAGKLQKYIN